MIYFCSVLRACIPTMSMLPARQMNHAFPESPAPRAYQTWMVTTTVTIVIPARTALHVGAMRTARIITRASPALIALGTAHMLRGCRCVCTWFSIPPEPWVVIRMPKWCQEGAAHSLVSGMGMVVFFCSCFLSTRVDFSFRLVSYHTTRPHVPCSLL